MSNVIKINNIHNIRKKWSPEVLVIGPGGLKGFAELGALHCLDNANILNDVHTIIGVSIGSIIGLLYVCGYDFSEISDIGLSVDLFKDYDINLWTMLENRGIISQDVIRNKLKNAISSKLTRIPTMSELYTIYKKNFITVTYNFSIKEPVYMNYMSYPDISVIDAVLASSSIPFIFYEFKYNGQIYIDGALGNPYPVNITEGMNVLGLYIADIPKCDTTTLNVANNPCAIIYAPINELRKNIINNASDNCKHIKLVVDMKDITGLSLTVEQRKDIFNAGFLTAELFIKENDLGE